MNTLVTGGAGFIGSHLVRSLLVQGHHVTVVDNFSTGSWENLSLATQELDLTDRNRLRIIESDVQDVAGLKDLDVIFHLAALGSVPRSLAHPMVTHEANVTGFLAILEAARLGKVPKVIYASSSSVYGDADPHHSRVEGNEGIPLSPYAASKMINEVYAATYEKAYGLKCVGLRFFNVYGPRQNPSGEYAAVIPRWISQMIAGAPVAVYGDGLTIRDYTYVADVVVALNKAMICNAPSHVYNVGTGTGTTLYQLYMALQALLGPHEAGIKYEPARNDAKRSICLPNLASRELDFRSSISLAEGLRRTIEARR